VLLLSNLYQVLTGILRSNEPASLLFLYQIMIMIMVNNGRFHSLQIRKQIEKKELVDI